MRKISYYIILVLLALSQTILAAPAKKKSNTKKKAVSAKTWKGANRNIHHVAMWGGGGYSGLLNQYENNRFIGGGGGLIGVGYEYKYDHFILNAGPEFRIFTSLDDVTVPGTYDVAMMGDGYNQTKHYTITSHMPENHLVGQVTLPVMLGGLWNRFYFLAGMKVGYTLLGTYTHSGTYSSSITDESAFDPSWVNMANHGAVTDAPLSASGNTAYGLDIIATAEVGLNINGLLSQAWNEKNKARRHPWHMRVAVFADYGVANLTRPAQGPLVTVDEQTVNTRSLHVSDWAGGRMNSLLVGVKFTALLQMNKPVPPKPQKPAMVVFVTDEQTSKAVASAAVDITPLEAKKPRTTHRITNKKGMAVAKLSAGPYHVALSHPSYEALEHEYSHGEWDDTLTLAMTPKPEPEVIVEEPPIVREQPIILHNLFFATKQTTILPESEPALQDLYTMLAKHPEIRIRIIGHTDNVGTERFNQKLSEGRANSVRDYLIEMGIEPERIEAEGKGETQPITTNETEEGRAQNRRVEFIVL